MNIKSEEINKFTSIAKEWWDPNGSFKMLHEINLIRLNFILNNIDRMRIGELRVLDVGCGGGILCESLAKSGFKDLNITGIDAGFENIEIAKSHAKDSNLRINYINKTLENFENDEKFDIVISFEVVEHCENYELFLKQISSLVKSGGLLFLSTINRNIKSYLQAIVGAEWVLRWIPRGTHEWSKFLKPHEINNILIEYNIEIQKMSGIKFDIFGQKWFESNDLDINYMIVGKKV